MSPGLLCAADNDWSCDLTPYLWVPTVTLESSVPSTPGEVPEVDHFQTHVTAGFMMAAAVQYRSVGVLTDFAWARLRTQSTDPSVFHISIDVRSDFYDSTTAVTYWIPIRGRFQAQVLAGAASGMSMSSSLQSVAFCRMSAFRSISTGWIP